MKLDYDAILERANQIYLDNFTERLFPWNNALRCVLKALVEAINESEKPEVNRGQESKAENLLGADESNVSQHGMG